MSRRRGGRRRSCCRPGARPGRAGGDRRRARGRNWRGRQLAQQRSHPRRHLLSDRARQDPALRRRQGDAVRVLPRVRRSARAMRQAPGGSERRRGRQTRRAQGPGRRQRRHRSCVAERQGGARARARARRRAGAAVALDRHHRCPCLHAGAQRRRRGPWRHDRLRDAGPRRARRRAGACHRNRRPRAHAHLGRSCRERRWSRRAGARALDSPACRPPRSRRSISPRAIIFP